MYYKIVKSGEWYNIVVSSTVTVVDGFLFREDAERYMAHLEAEDAKGVLEQERK